MAKLKFNLSARQLVARNLRELRENKEMSQFSLSKLAHMSQTYISQVESANRNISLDALEQLAIALDVDVVRLLEK